jgi:hypothetical protein
VFRPAVPAVPAVAETADVPVSPAPAAALTPQQVAHTHDIDADVLASFDPVAELAEVVSEMEATAGRAQHQR